MARCIFRQIDLTRALKAARAAGFDVVGYEINPDGKIIVRTGKPEVQEKTPLDQWITNHARPS
jgi:hypothetical protein